MEDVKCCDGQLDTSGITSVNGNVSLSSWLPKEKVRDYFEVEKINLLLMY